MQSDLVMYLKYVEIHFFVYVIYIIPPFVEDEKILIKVSLHQEDCFVSVSFCLCSTRRSKETYTKPATTHPTPKIVNKK